MTHKEITNTVTWAVEVAQEHNRRTLEVVARFKELHKAGMSVVQARNAVEREYALGGIA